MMTAHPFRYPIKKIEILLKRALLTRATLQLADLPARR